VPGTEGTVTFNSDQFAMFNVSDMTAQESQTRDGLGVMSPEFQITFNLVKGSVPARTDISADQFDMCGQMGMAQLAEAAASGTPVRLHGPWPRQPAVRAERDV
jgi:glucose/mannose transport system substrate-binding protein